jgi:hypothetical protein
MKNYIKSRWLAAIIAGLLVACGGGGGDDEPDVVDQIIASQLNFEGVYADGNGLTLELKDGMAIIRALGNSGLQGLFRTGEAFMKAMDNKGDNRWIGYIATIKGSQSAGTQTVYWDYGSAILKDGVMTSTDSDGNVRTFRYVGPTWTGSTAPSTPPPTTTAPPATGTTAPKVESALNLQGDRKSKRVFNITIPSGTKSLEVTLTESPNGGRQQADLFVRRGAEAVIVDEPKPYSWTADCASVESNRSPERCVFNNPAAATYYITVYGYHEYWGADLKITRR